MDASQYKDYVLFMLFIKYISDKYSNSNDFAPPVTIPKGASFQDMIALKGKSDIGDRINTQIIQPLIDANAQLARSDFPDFNDPNKLGEGQAMVERLSNLVGIFQKPELDFSQNRADHDGILGDVGSTMSEYRAELTFRVPQLDEQTAIATALSDMDAELAALEARRDKTRALKQGMMQELLTGRTRLV